MIAAPGLDAPECISGLSPISLDDLNAVAALQVRIDRKYVLSEAQLVDLVTGMDGRLAILDIEGRRSFGYESVYFDTARLDAFHGSAYGRRRRFKVRTRSYLDTETTMLEVKTKGPRKVTVKVRRSHGFADRDTLDLEARRFVDHSTGHQHLGVALWPTLTTRYRRSTVADLDDVARLTIDVGLTCVDWMRNEVALTDRFIVETKSAGRPSGADRFLWHNGIRPEKISKYGTGLAALNSTLPSNKWHRTLKRHFPSAI